MKYIIPFFILLGSCRPSLPFVEGLTRDKDSVTFNKIINKKQIRIYAIVDSTLVISQDDERVDTLPFRHFFYGFNDQMDLNKDRQMDLLIYGVPDMHGQMQPFTFLSDEDGWLHYRPDLNQYNLSYDSTIQQVISFYEGGVNCRFLKEIYEWKEDSLKLIRGVALEAYNNENGWVVYWYASDPQNPYNIIKRMDGIAFDTAVFRSFPSLSYATEFVP